MDFLLRWMEERMDSPIAASAAARAITKIAKISPFNWRLFWSKKNHREGFIPFGLCLVFVFCETQKQGKTETDTGL